jgi:hypothetical protein
MSLFPESEVCPLGKGNVHSFIHPQGWTLSNVKKKGGVKIEFHPQGSKFASKGEWVSGHWFGYLRRQKIVFSATAGPGPIVEGGFWKTKKTSLDLFDRRMTSHQDCSLLRTEHCYISMQQKL